MPPLSNPEQRSVTVSAEAHGSRLDRVLAGAIADVSRTRLKGLVHAGCVRLDGEPVEKPGTTVSAGQVIEVELRDIRPVRTGSDESGLVVLHEDDDLIVINKPPRMLVHPAPGVEGGTVSDLARERYGELPTLQGVDRPGIVHRLDAGTSGVMVLGRSKSAFKSLMSQFRARTVEKSYLALVYGSPRFDTGWIEGPIGRSTKEPSRFEVVTSGAGRPSATYYEVAERFDGLAILECRPKTGRTHQIRVHLASIELHVYGDPLYRRRGGHSVVLSAKAPKLTRQALHAQRITFEHPGTKERVTFEAPVAPDIEGAIEWMRTNRPAG